MAYDVLIEQKANKELSQLDRQSQKRIYEALKSLRDFGFTQRLDIKKLQGYTGKYRLRLGIIGFFSSSILELLSSMLFFPEPSL